MKNQWVKKPEPEAGIVQILRNEVRLPYPLAVILAQRGVNSFDSAKEFFRPELAHLHDPFLMKDMELAVDRVIRAIQNHEKILVYGDYDVDGTTAVAMMYDFLLSVYPNVHYYVPHRYSEGYGISFTGIDYAEENGYSLIIALDCGIKAVDKIDYANQKKIDFIICDHHLPGEVLPAAVAVLDPKRSDCSYPFKGLSGCGVGFKLIQALGTKLNVNKEKIYSYLDLLVVSIAADIVPITGENRILAYYGLMELQKNPSPGLKGLMGEEIAHAGISEIVFNLAPKINATGRLEHASQSVEILISKDEVEIVKIAAQIKTLNIQRKETDGNVTEEAIELIKKNNEEENYSTVVYSEDWHKGVLGIVASRLTETYYRPTLVLTEGSDGEITGSARSVKDFDIYEIIDNCSDLLSRYGGHRFAAGLTMPKENLQKFKEKFESLVKEKIRQTQRIPSIDIDTEIDFSEITPSFLRILKQMRPFGPENMTPVFLTKSLIAGNLKKIGKNGDHLRLTLQDQNRKMFEAVAFGMGDLYRDFQYGKFDVVYSIEENIWKDKVYLQFNIKDVRFAE